MFFELPPCATSLHTASLGYTQTEILMEFLSLETIILTTSDAASNENSIKITTFLLESTVIIWNASLCKCTQYDTTTGKRGA